MSCKLSKNYSRNVALNEMGNREKRKIYFGKKELSCRSLVKITKKGPSSAKDGSSPLACDRPLDWPQGLMLAATKVGCNRPFL
jgi:hypothetical protein